MRVRVINSKEIDEKRARTLSASNYVYDCKATADTIIKLWLEENNLQGTFRKRSRFLVSLNRVFVEGMATAYKKGREDQKFYEKGDK